ncbi:MAG: hypothetical protein H0T89_14315 [Deltaproteobacteria bacterium]|nr:hypothetical protein [Deltaproteobacteria bacterium]MDQ3296080.1 hypothetical protein [Myxococcota bacterium]
MRLACWILLLTAGPASAQPAPGVLAHGIFTTTVTAEIDASEGTFGDPTSLAPDLSLGITDEVTLSVLHSTFGRTGFRGSAGAGLCVTDACGPTYDNAGAEAYVGMTDGTFALAANGGIHATSFDQAHYAAKLGARMRLRAGPLSLVTLPSIAVAISHRDEQSDRLFVPINASVPVGGGVSVGVITGFKAPLDELAARYELAAGAFVQYVASPSVAFAASWVHGSLIGGEDALPAETNGVDIRALQIWITITRSAYPRYR